MKGKTPIEPWLALGLGPRVVGGGQSGAGAKSGE
jgi:hypothetical protein